jgi:hypothetical protein
MNTYFKTKNGKIYILWSDNTKEETYSGIPEHDWTSGYGGYDPEFFITETIPYSEVLVSDSNLTIVKTTHHNEGHNFNYKKMRDIIIHQNRVKGGEVEGMVEPVEPVLRFMYGHGFLSFHQISELEELLGKSLF